MPKRFGLLRRVLACFCAALCLALSAQVVTAILDRIQHISGIAHDADTTAGDIVYLDVGEADHDHDGGAGSHHRAPTDADGPIDHAHVTPGALEPLMGSAVAPFALPSRTIVANELTPRIHPDPAERRRERPPKNSSNA
jgi:hypothetical protein